MTAIVAIVDDDRRVLESLENLLESAGHVVRVFSSGPALLQDECFAEIDCLITDIGMPVMDGFELERLARVARPDLPVILVTGQELNDRDLGSTERSDAFFRKPCDGQALLAAVSSAVARLGRGG